MELEAIGNSCKPSPEGSEGIPVNQLIAVIFEEGEDAATAGSLATKTPAGSVDNLNPRQPTPRNRSWRSPPSRV